jgi:uncharacterized membrane protein
MNIVLVNNNPVVTKLVTLSAQKTNDKLKIIASPVELDVQECDVLILDDELLESELYKAVNEKVHCRKKIYMGARGSIKPDDFDMMVNKPFLPTDLVDLFTTLSAEMQAPHYEEPFVTQNPIEEDMFDEEEIDLDDAISSLEESDEDEDMLSLDNEELDLENLDDGLDEVDLSLDNELFDSNTKSTGILDKDELEEVQALLKDEDLNEEEFVFDLDETEEITDLEDETAAGELDFNEMELEDISSELTEDAESTQEIDNELLLDNLDELAAEEMNFDLEDADLDDLSKELLEPEPEAEQENEPIAALEETLSDEKEISLDEPAQEEETIEETGFDDDLEALLEQNDSEDDFTDELDMDDDTLKHAVDSLSEEELNAPIDEDILLDIINDEEIESDFEVFDEFDGLSENALRSALGEEIIASDEDEVIEETLGDVLEEEAEEVVEAPETTQEGAISTPQDGVRALQTLIDALQNEAVTKSLKEMNITINISFGENK